jgi:hypothetical protein
MSEHEDAERENYHELLGDAKDLLLLLLGLGGPVSPIEVIWGAVEALVADATGRIHEDARRRQADPSLARTDHSAATLRAALRTTFSDALEAARILKATDRHDPSWQSARDQLDQLLSAIQANSAELAQVASNRVAASSVRSPERQLHIPIDPAPPVDLRGSARRWTDERLSPAPSLDPRHVRRGTDPLGPEARAAALHLEELASDVPVQDDHNLQPSQLDLLDEAESLLESSDRLQAAAVAWDPDEALDPEEIFPSDSEQPQVNPPPAAPPPSQSPGF